jgi:hypothetical protein
VTNYIGVLWGLLGVFFEEPHSENPYGAWTAGSYWGFISTTGKFLELNIYTDKYQSGSSGKIIFSGRKEP